MAHRLVLLYSRPITGAGASLKARLAPSIPGPGIIAVGNVNARSGDELFVRGCWIGAEVDLYSFYAGRLVRAGGKLYIDGASADKFGFDCVRKPAPEIIQRDYSLIGPTIYGRWRLTSYIYAWHGATLDLVRRDTTVHHGLPGQRAMRPGPGCDPLPGYR
jgi:hypothetical protein